MAKLVEKSFEDIRNKKYLSLIYRAMDMIGNKYGAIITRYSYSEESLKIDICERNYIIFLSYIIGQIDSVRKKPVIGHNLFLNGELYKHLDSISNNQIRLAYSELEKLRKERHNHQNENDEKEEEKNDKKEESYKNVRPDFVIHESHKEDYETKGQKLVIEAKTTSTLMEVDFCWDFLKLNAYIDNLKFKNAIYIIINTNIKDIKKYVKIYSDKIKYISERIDRLWFFVQNWNGKGMNPIRLYQLKNSKNDQ